MRSIENKYPISGRVIRVEPIRRHNGEIAIQAGGARLLTFDDGRQIQFSEGALPYNGALTDENLVGCTLRWSLTRSGPLSSIVV